MLFYRLTRDRVSNYFLRTFVFVLLASSLLTKAGAVQQGEAVSLISLSSRGAGSGNADSYINSAVPRSALSRDGRFLAFESEASDLVSQAADVNRGADVFVHDRQGATTRLVSIDLTGSQSGNGISGAPIISGDGRYIAFESFASNLVANDNNFSKDVFVRDLEKGATAMVTVTPEGRPSSGAVFFVSVFGMSADGRYVLFTSEADDLVSNDRNDSADLFVRDMVAGKTTLVSVNREGVASGNRSSLTSGGFFSFDPVISADGRFVAFTSFANDLVDNDNVCLGPCDGTNGLQDVFVRDLNEQVTTLVSVNLKGDSGNSPSHDPAISADGRRVAFRSFANNLVANDRTANADIYVRDLAAKKTTLASVNLAGDNGGTDGRGNGLNSSQPLISADGRFVAFSSTAIDLAPNKTNLLTSDVFVRDIEAGTTLLVSVNRAGTDSTSTANNLFVSVPADFSADGRLLVFRSTAPDLVANDSNNSDDVFVRDLQSAATMLVSVNRAGVSSANDVSLTADISADGKVVAFDSLASDLANADTNNAPDVFAFTIATAPVPEIIKVKYKLSGKLTVKGENFDEMTRLFVDDKEQPARLDGSGTLVVKKLSLAAGSHEARVVNKDGHASSITFTVK